MTISLAAADVAADAPAAPLVRALAPLAGAHPLADRTGRIPLTARIPDGVDARSLGLLPVAPGIGAIHLAPGDVDAFEKAHPGLGLSFAPPRRTWMDASKKWTDVYRFRKDTGATGKGVVVGIIDTGLDVAHADFRDAEGKTRVAWMLTASAPVGLHPDLETTYGCSDPAQAACAIYSRDDIAAMLASGNVTIKDEEGHGTHVSSIAAGNGGIWKNKYPVYVGMAPEATLIVAAPSAPGGGFYDPDILKAAKFIFDRADELGMPAVVNLSIGGDFGPHDGSSNLEKGLAAMVGDDKPGHAIVVAAGNSGALYVLGDNGPYGPHTETHVSPDSDVRVPILSSQAKAGQGYVWITFRPGDDVSVALEGPGGETWVGFTSPGDDTGYKKDNNSAGVINNEISDKSPLAPGTNGAVVVFSGEWADQSEFAIHLKGQGEAELWVTGGGDVGPTAPIGLLFERAIKQGTISVPASDPHLLAVGCTINRIGWKPLIGKALELTSLGGVEDPTPDGICYFSSAGPTPAGFPKPEISAPGGFVAAAMSADADPRTHPGSLFDQPGCPDANKCYVVDDTHAITIGTSMSSPHVAGAIALLFQLDPTLTQGRVTEVLQAGARYPSGYLPLDYQLGPGELDMNGAQQALAKEMTSTAEADPATSWFVLSSAYARPDSSFPVVGTIELRHTDGKIASGLDGTDLALHLDNGVVVQPITKVRHGLFQFAVAGLRGAGGGELTLDVTYRGISLGTRTLPIGTDIWAAKGGVDAVSAACHCSAVGTGETSTPALATLLLGLAAVSRRRRDSTASRSPRRYPRCR